MNKQLSSEDAQAVDLLLERPDGHDDTPTVNQIFARPVQGPMERSLDSVEKILALLDAMPAADPPADLALKTLSRLKQARLNNVTPSVRSGHPVAPEVHPHA